MSKWFFGVFVAAVLIGCGGSPRTSNPVTTTAGTTGGQRQAASVNLGVLSSVQTTILSGQGRRAPGDLTATFRFITFQNGVTDFIPTQDQALQPDMRIRLNGYTINSRSFNHQLASNIPSKTYREYPLEIFSVEREQADGTFVPVSGQQPALRLATPLATTLTLFPGRQTTLQFVIDDAIITVDALGNVRFNEALFKSRNYDGPTQSIRGFLSDYIAFPVTDLPDAAKPRMSLSGLVAEDVLFSGDGIAQRRGFDADNTFELLAPVNIQRGIIRRGVTLGGVPAAGTYSVREPDPRDLSGVARLTSVAGTWRPYTDVLSDFPTTVMVSFPGANDGTDQQLVLFQRDSGGRVVLMHQGVVRFNAAAGTGTFRVWPINQAVSGSTANEVRGTVSSLVVVNGAVKSGSYTITTAPAGLPYLTTGGFVVFRR